MNRQKSFIAITLLSIILGACKTHTTKTAATATATTPATVATTPTEPVLAQQPVKTKHVYRFITSFYSKGGGIDNAAHNRLKQYLSTRKPIIAVDEIGWGREGEIDMGFDLKELSTTEQAEFITQVKALLKDSELVHFAENSSSVNARD